MDVKWADQGHERLAETPVTEMTSIDIVYNSQVIYQVKLLVNGSNLALRPA